MSSTTLPRIELALKIQADIESNPDFYRDAVSWWNAKYSPRVYRKKLADALRGHHSAAERLASKSDDRTYKRRHYADWCFIHRVLVAMNDYPMTEALWPALPTADVARILLITVLRMCPEFDPARIGLDEPTPWGEWGIDEKGEFGRSLASVEKISSKWGYRWFDLVEVAWTHRQARMGRDENAKDSIEWPYVGWITEGLDVDRLNLPKDLAAALSLIFKEAGRAEFIIGCARQHKEWCGEALKAASVLWERLPAARAAIFSVQVELAGARESFKVKLTPYDGLETTAHEIALRFAENVRGVCGVPTPVNSMSPQAQWDYIRQRLLNVPIPDVRQVATGMRQEAVKAAAMRNRGDSKTGAAEIFPSASARDVAMKTVTAAPGK